MTVQEKIDQFIAYYKSLLILQYVNKENASAEIGAITDSFIADGLIFQIERAFDLDSSVGPQLTTLAKYFGVDRDVYLFEIDRDLFEFADYSETVFSSYFGFRDVSINPDPGSELGGYQDVLSSKYTLNDDELRFYCKIAKVSNNSSSTYKNIKEVLYNDFDSRIEVLDNKNMTLTMFVPVDLIRVIRIALLQNVFFRPACVGMLVFSVDNTEELFSFGTYDEPDITALGFGSYSDVLSGEMLSYDDSVTI